MASLYRGDGCCRALFLLHQLGGADIAILHQDRLSRVFDRKHGIRGEGLFDLAVARVDIALF